MSTTALPPGTPSAGPTTAPAPSGIRRVLKISGGVGSVLVVVVSMVLWLGQLGQRDQHVVERAYLDAKNQYSVTMTADVKQVTDCQHTWTCKRDAYTRLLADNAAYLQWCNSVKVPDRFKAAHAEFIKGASLHDQGGRQLLESPSGSEAEANATRLINEGDAALARGNALLNALLKQEPVYR